VIVAGIDQVDETGFSKSFFSSLLMKLVKKSEIRKYRRSRLIVSPTWGGRWSHWPTADYAGEGISCWSTRWHLLAFPWRNLIDALALRPLERRTESVNSLSVRGQHAGAADSDIQTL